MEREISTMPLVTTKEMFEKAYNGGYAIGAFNVNNMEIVQGITEAAKDLNAPLILQVSKGARAYANHTYLMKLVEAAVIETGLPIALHLDHGDSFELCKSCIDGGFTSVMIDGSSKSFEDNIALTRQVVEYAHDHGVVVEAELGTLAGIEDEVKVSAEDISMEVSNIGELYRNVLDLFNNFNPAKEIHLMQTLSNTSLSESQFAQIIGRCRCYQALPIGYQKSIPKLLITDSQINSVCRDFYHNEAFGMKDNAISLFDFHNLLTQSNKNSYVDTYLQRAVNATEISVGINNVLRGIDDKYQWFLS